MNYEYIDSEELIISQYLLYMKNGETNCAICNSNKTSKWRFLKLYPRLRYAPYRYKVCNRCGLQEYKYKYGRFEELRKK